MEFARSDFQADVAAWAASKNAAQKAWGHNYIFDENITPSRLADFEGFAFGQSGLDRCIAQYFDESVQGARSNHQPSTFDTAKGACLMDGIERNQKILHLVRIDQLLHDMATGPDDAFAALKHAIPARSADVLRPLVRRLNDYPGARPIFVAFRAEVAEDLGEEDWASRLISRLGLGHHALPGPTKARFALLEHTVGEVLDAYPNSAFAIPTVLDTKCNEFFYPAPRDAANGFTVDLEALGRLPIRECLHRRIVWKERHLAKAAEIQGPLTFGSLSEIRDAHLIGLRDQTGRSDYGAFMNDGE